MNNVKHLVIVNGHPQSGKTTFEQACAQYMRSNYIATVHICSSVDTIYKVSKMLGWDGVKTDEWRKDMAALKDMYTRYCNGPTREIMRHMFNIPDDENNYVVFYDVREVDEIAKLKKIFEFVGPCMSVVVHTLFIERVGYDIKHGNTSDDDVSNYRYDTVIQNNNDVDMLRVAAVDYCRKLFGG